MFPELLQKAGVRTIAAHAHFYFDQKAGFRQGFDVYEIVPGLSRQQDRPERHQPAAPRDRQEDARATRPTPAERFFAWFHFLDPHDEYMPHAGIGPYGKTARDKYDAEVTFTDQHVGKLLEFVDAAAVGQGHRDHHLQRSRRGLRRAQDVPPRLRALRDAGARAADDPGARASRRGASTTPRSASIWRRRSSSSLGAPAEPTFQGKSLVPELYGKAAEERDVIVDLPRTSDNDRRRALIHGKYKLIAYGDDDGYELYDLAADPGEKKDLKREDKEAFETMKERSTRPGGDDQGRLPEEHREAQGQGQGQALLGYSPAS